MNMRIYSLFGMAGLLASPAVGQVERGAFIDEMRQAVQQSKVRGEPANRCSLGFQLGDNGRVLLVFGNASVRPGDVIKSINGSPFQGTKASDFSLMLRRIGPSAVVSVEVEQVGVVNAQQMTCSNAMAYNGPLAAAQQAAAKKDFKGCISQLQNLPANVLQQWYFQYVAVNCAVHSKSIVKQEEVVRVHAWMDALVRESAFVQEERDAAAKAVRFADAYFNSNGRSDLYAKLSASFDGMHTAAGIAKPSEPKWGKFRETAEWEVRSRLIDPDSAKFEWPFGFSHGTWKPLLQKRIEGYWTCGQVNARNRMGGYVGSSSFVVVMDDENTVKFVEIGSGKENDLTASQCAKSVKFLPPAPPELLAVGPVPVSARSIADELEKLASLLDRGIITQAEFEAQKAKLLQGR